MDAHIIISQTPPPPRCLWLRPSEDTLYVHTPKGWIPLQNGIFMRIRDAIDKLKEEVTRTEGGGLVSSDEGNLITTGSDGGLYAAVNWNEVQ